jgi:glycosyltransferase involved in cell wall biosynthesis
MATARSGRSDAPRVAYLITDSGMGGAEQEVCHLAREFTRRGWAVAAISMLALESPIADLAGIGVRTYSLGMRLGVPDPRALVALGRLLRRWRPDVLHAHMVHANLLGRLSRLVAPTPMVISTIHNENEGARWRYVAYRLTDRLSDVTTTVSRVAQVEAARRGSAPAGSILLVPNGLSTAPYARDAAVRARARAALDLGDRFTWLAVGRLAEPKGYRDMVTAFAEVVREHPGATLLIAGTGSLEDEIRAEAHRLGIDDSVRLLGLRSDVPALMQAADGFLMTSLWEGLPMVLLEAGASGLPVVATDVGGTRDAVLDGVSGYVTPAATPGATAQAIGRVMRMSEVDREAMGAAGRRHIQETFDIGAVGDIWERLYRRSKRLRGSPD